MPRVTLEDVGKASGVSRATASLVLRGDGRVSEETRDRVRAAMKELGYVYNRHAASMRDQRTLLLGLVATDITNPFFGEVTMAIERVARGAGYTLLAGYSGDDFEQQTALLRTMAQHQVDGVMIQPALGTTSADLDLVGEAPVTQFVRHVSESIDFVGLDDERGGELVGHHLLEIGARRVVYVGGSDRSTARRDRIAGIRRSLAGAADLKAHATGDANNLEGGATATAEVYDSGTLPQAIVAHSDAVAFGVYAEMRRRGLTPGSDAAVVSFDDLPLAMAQYPALTSVGIDTGRLGESVAHTLLDRLQTPGAPARRTRMTPTLRIRSSTTSWRPRA